MRITITERSILLCLYIWSSIWFLTNGEKTKEREATSVHQDTLGPGGGAADIPNIQQYSDNNMALIKAMENSLLTQFGLSQRPRPNVKNLIIPQYMKELYKKRSSIYSNSPNANTIRSFHHIEQNATLDDTTQLIFNISSLPQTEILTSAELRIYRHAFVNTDTRLQIEQYKHRIDVYEILKPETENRPSVTRLIDTKLVDMRNSTWETFDITPAVINWQISAIKNVKNVVHGIEIQILSHDGQRADISAGHVRLRREVKSTYEDGNSWNSVRPLIVIYSDDGKSHRSRRDTRRRSRSHKRKNHNEQCQRHPLYVDFSDVGWTDWIVAPPGYKAFYCHGDCPFPLADHLNSTNHAIVQTLVNSVNPQAVPKACCVPTELSSISMLYVDEESKVVLKVYQDMVVEGCGCR